MLDLTPRDFHRVRSILNELVCQSNFFPVDAKNDDWFRPREDVEAFTRRITSMTTTTTATSSNTVKDRRRHYRAQSEDGRRSAFVIARRPRCHSMDSIESSSTTTETLSASSTSFSSCGSGVEPQTMRKVPTEQYDDDSPNAVFSISQEDVEPMSILGVGGFCEVRLARVLRMRINHHINAASR
jgi:hypothetical protein